MSAWVVETERLGMRRLRPEDRDRLERLDWLDADRLLERCLEEYESRGHAFWALIRKRTGEFLGLCGLLAQDVEGVIELEVGYHLLPEHRGCGYATEAARGVMVHAFEVVGTARVISIIVPDNAASIAVATRNGLRYERAARFRGLAVGIYVAKAPER